MVLFWEKRCGAAKNLADEAVLNQPVPAFQIARNVDELSFGRACRYRPVVVIEMCPRVAWTR